MFKNPREMPKPTTPRPKPAPKPLGFRETLRQIKNSTTIKDDQMENLDVVIHMPDGGQLFPDLKVLPKRGDQIVIPGQSKLVQICNVRHHMKIDGHKATQTRIEMWTLNV